MVYGYKFLVEGIVPCILKNVGKESGRVANPGHDWPDPDLFSLEENNPDPTLQKTGSDPKKNTGNGDVKNPDPTRILGFGSTALGEGWADHDATRNPLQV